MNLKRHSIAVLVRCIHSTSLKIAISAMLGPAEAGNVNWQYEEIIPIKSDEVDASGLAETRWTALLWAAGNGWEEGLQVLLNHQFALDEADKGGRSALSWAAGNGQDMATKMLLDKISKEPKARKESLINQKDHQERTPLSWASENGYL